MEYQQKKVWFKIVIFSTALLNQTSQAVYCLQVHATYRIYTNIIEWGHQNHLINRVFCLEKYWGHNGPHLLNAQSDHVLVQYANCIRCV